uniref:Zinc finger, CCHC-type n=1 Tax=Tanacetum cinerariifolium TaxID=118510 RepID=A0A6L2KCK5_TANCI|nr:zinc finger, CCHC-type [Tanacetum cinerariifolium]
MAEEDAFLVNNVEGGLCVGYTDARIVGRCNSRSDRIREKWENDDYICRGHILNGMPDSLFNVYTNVESAKELWDSLESKYMVEDSLSEKFLGKDVGGSSVNMTEEGGKNKHRKQNKGKKRSNENNSGSGSNKKSKLEEDAFLVEDFEGALCADYTDELWDSLESKYMAEDALSKKFLHGKDDLSLVQLGSHLCIEKSLRVQDINNGKGKKRGFNDNNGGSGSNKKPKLECSKCGKTGHFKRYFCSGKKNNANVGGSRKGLRTNPKTKWINSGATTLVCKDRCWFKTYEAVEYGSVLYMGDDHFAPVHGKGSVVRVPNKRKKTTPYELWYKKRPNLSFLRVWGCRVVVRLPDPKRKTLGEKGIYCIFVGYTEHSKAYRPKDIIPNSNESQRDDHFDDVPSEISKPRKGCKWIFKKKMKFDGIIDKFKARLVIQGFRQKEGINYFDTYAPVARITTIRMLLALATIHNLVIHQMDIKTTFLNGDLDKEVYIKQPEGFVMPGNEHKEADVILGIKIKHENKGIVITQSHYIEKILKNFNREDCSSVSTPIDPVKNLKPNTGTPVDQLEYSRAIGFLMYAMTSTRPDIAYAVGRLSRFTSNPSRQHWKAITRMFKYLGGTKDYGLSYVRYPSVLEGYSDASWINHVEDSSFYEWMGVPAWGRLASDGYVEVYLLNGSFEKLQMQVQELKGPPM